MDTSDLISYAAVAAVTVGISLALLRITKIPTVVIICSAILVAVLYSAYFRISAGYWGKFAVIEFFWVAAYACAVSFALLGIGRLLKWPFFLPTRETDLP
jgi:hypothetical protein